MTPWTTSRRAAFIRVWTRGDSPRSIAVAFGLTVRGVYSRRRDFNLAPRFIVAARTSGSPNVVGRSDISAP